MSAVFIDGPTIEAFVNDKESFYHWVDESFNSIDVESKGELSREAFENRPGKFGSREFELQSKDDIRNMYNAVFERFDVDGSGTLDRKEFRDLMEEIILAKGRCIGKSPVLIILQRDSSLMGAVQWVSENQ